MSYDVFHSINIVVPEKDSDEIGVILEAICFEQGQTERLEDDAILNARRLEACMTSDLVGPKGSAIVVAGVFNYWMADQGFRLSKELSRRLRGTVVHLVLDMVMDELRVQSFTNGFETFTELSGHQKFWAGPKVAEGGA